MVIGNVVNLTELLVLQNVLFLATNPTVVAIWIDAAENGILLLPLPTVVCGRNK